MFKHHNFSVGDVLQISVRKVKSPSKFWAQIISNRKNKYTALKKEIQDYYNDCTFSKSRIADPSEGKRCVVKGNDRVWHRAVIDMVLICPQRLIINCYLVDEVKFNYIVPANNVYEAPAWVWEEPIQSSCFALHGIVQIKLRPDYLRDKMDKVKSNNLKKWDPASVQQFEDFCTDSLIVGLARPHFNAEIVYIDEKNILWIKLYLSSDKNSATINELMVSMGMSMLRNEAGTKTDGNINYLHKEESKERKSNASSDDSYQTRVTEFRDHVAQCINEKNLPRDEMTSLYEDINQWLMETFSSDGISKNTDEDLERKPLENISTEKNTRSDKGSENYDIPLGWGTGSVYDIASKYSTQHEDTCLVDVPESRSNHGCFGNEVHNDVGFAVRKSSSGAVLRSTGTQTENMKTIALSSSSDTITFYKNASFQIDMDEMLELDNSRVISSIDAILPSVDVNGQHSDIVLEDGKNLRRERLGKQSLADGSSLLGKNSKKGNLFYSKAPCPSVVDKDDENSNPIVRVTEKQRNHTIRADNKKEENQKDEVNLHAVVSSVTPDNLHSGSVILIRGHKPPNPISLFCKAPFPPNVIDILENKLRYRGPRLLQAHVWPALLQLHDIMAIATRNGGKTMAYLPAMASMLLRTQERNPKDSKQPVAVVVTTNWDDVRNIHRAFEEFLSQRDDLNVIAVHGGPASEDAKAADIASGCSVLISTAPSLVRICHAKYMNFSQLRYLVLDDINVLVEEFTEEVKEIMRLRFEDFTSSVARCDTKKPCQLICLGSQWTEGVSSYCNRFLKQKPLLLISHPLEAAVYGNVKHSVIACSEVQRMEHVLEILKNSDLSEDGLAMFVHTPSEADQLHELVSSLGFYCEKAHSNMHQGELDEFKFHYEEGSKPILIATDDVIPELDIYCMKTILHYTFPTNQHDLGIRLSTMQSFFSPKGVKNEVVAQSIFILTPSFAKYAGDLVTFLKRVGQKIPQSLTNIANSEAKSQEVRKGKIPLCPYLKAFGTCRDERICPHRHQISILDRPNNSDRYVKVPTAGHVRLQVTNVVNATHYWARLDALRITEGKKSKIHKYAAVHAEIAIDLSMHFELHSESVAQLTEASPKLKKIYALSKSYERVYVLPVTKSESKIESEVEYWTCNAQKPQDCSLLTHWKTSGGAKKVRVRLVDTGSVRIVRHDELLRIPSKIAKIPFQAIEVRVCGVRPVDKDISWHSQVDEFVHEKLYQKTIEGNIVAALGRTIWLHPVEVRSKLPLTGCIISEFSVARELVKVHYADKNPEQVSILKQMMDEVEARDEVSSSSSCHTPTESSLSLKLRNQEGVCQEKDCITSNDIRNESESVCESIQPCSTVHNSSTESISSNDSKTRPERKESTTRNVQVTTNTSMPDTSFSANQTVESVHDNIDSGMAKEIESSFHVKESQDDVDEDLVSIPAPTSVTLESLPTPVIQEAPPKIDIDKASQSTLYLLGTLSDLFATPNLRESQKLKILHEIHVKCVGCPYDVTEKDLVGLNKVLSLCKTTEEKRLVLATLLSLAMDQVPVLSIVQLEKIIEIGCKLDLSKLDSEPIIRSLAEIAFLLVKELIDSLRKVTEHNLNQKSCELMISYLTSMLSGYNATSNSDIKEQAAEVLGKLLEYEDSLKKDITEEKNKKTVPKIKKKPKVTDVLNYDRFNQIDTDSESVQRPYTPLVCRFESSIDTDSILSDSTIDGSCRFLKSD